MENQNKKSTKLKMAELKKMYYPPSDSYELYDPETGQFFNNFGDPLRDPEEYNDEPFGDE